MKKNARGSDYKIEENIAATVLNSFTQLHAVYQQQQQKQRAAQGGKMNKLCELKYAHCIYPQPASSFETY
jgi:hypothetical protein